jgi:hypothetical protein
MSVASYTKDPGATLDYSLDWGSWLQNGELITAAAWSVSLALGGSLEAGDLSMTHNSVSGGVATAWFTAGVTGTQYLCACTITTSLGRMDVRSILIDVEPR